MVTVTTIKHMTYLNQELKKKKKGTSRFIKGLLVQTTLILVGSGVSVYFDIPFCFNVLKNYSEMTRRWPFCC